MLLSQPMLNYESTLKTDELHNIAIRSGFIIAILSFFMIWRLPLRPARPPCAGGVAMFSGFALLRSFPSSPTSLRTS